MIVCVEIQHCAALTYIVFKFFLRFSKGEWNWSRHLDYATYRRPPGIVLFLSQRNSAISNSSLHVSVFSFFILTARLYSTTQTVVVHSHCRAVHRVTTEVKVEGSLIHTDSGDRTGVCFVLVEITSAASVSILPPKTLFPPISHPTLFENRRRKMSLWESSNFRYRHWERNKTTDKRVKCKSSDTAKGGSIWWTCSSISGCRKVWRIAWRGCFCRLGIAPIWVFIMRWPCGVDRMLTSKN